MSILQGWKEIAEHLHVTARTAQRWERLSLPVRRVSNSDCSPVVALSEEINHWARSRKMNGRHLPVGSHAADYFSTQHQTGELINQLGALWARHQMLLARLKKNTKRSSPRTRTN